jgi:pimeloyl-ACP methyl ester carboxylesterase
MACRHPISVQDRVARIAAPTLVVAGNKDVATPFEGHGGEILKRISGAQLKIMPAAHVAPVEMPDAFAAIVTSFLSGTAAA